ncbi:MAG: L-threonylcarbamoyladenylate synthase [Defluviitaleaceae bacterium]|nr:L-threonylcarbamoyladenylate synthase [Defluviitaleaceae bacterium]
MHTIIRKLEVGAQTVEVVKVAAEVIKSGGLVAFPTETVYGLGANALDPEACAKIYAVKGRPRDNPLIVHVNNDFDLERIARLIPAGARVLMDAFWPGPMTLVLKSRPGVFSHGHEDTVAIRVPNHIAARLLIHHSGVPIAAPSANLSGRPSPTDASHVITDLNGKIGMILDGGACKHGLESTVIDFSDDTPRILRPGSITSEMIAGVIGKIELCPDSEVNIPKSPGTKYAHYAPKGKMTVVIGKPDAMKEKINELMRASTAKNPVDITSLLGQRAEQIAANLFAVLRDCDARGHDEIFVCGVDEEGLGAAIMNRMKKAAGGNVVEV